MTPHDDYPRMLIGESPGEGGLPQFPLDPLLPSSIGSKLFDAVDMVLHDYCKSFILMNLFYEYPGSKWPLNAARERAKEVLEAAYYNGGADLILLGRRVAAAFGLMSVDFYQWTHIGKINMVVIPQPSTTNLWYFETDYAQITEMFWQDYKSNLVCTKTA